jgi:hypothetical protein
MRRFAPAFLALLLSALPIALEAADQVTLSPKNYEEFAPGGRKADAIYGDYVLRNDLITAVIADPEVWPGRSGSRKSINTFEGRLIDLTTRQNPSDQLDLYDPVRVGPQLRGNNQQRGRDGQPKQELFPDEAEFYKLPTRKDLSGKRVQLTIPWLDDAKEVRYILEDGKPYLEIQTDYTGGQAPPPKGKGTRNNEDSQRGTVLILDQTPVTSKLISTGLDPSSKFYWAYKIGSGQAYGVYCPDATFKKFPAPLDDNYINYVAVPTSDSKGVVTQWLIPGKDLFEVNAHLAQALGKEVKNFTITVRDSRGPVANAIIEATRAGTVVGIGITDDKGVLKTQIAPGEIQIKVATPGGQSATAKQDPASSDNLNILLDPAGLLALAVTDQNGKPIPCKAELRALEGTAPLDLGPDAAERNVGNLIYSPDGKIRQAIPPGNYKLFVSHGPEYDAFIETINLSKGGTYEKAITLARVVDSTGFVSANFDNRTTASRHYSNSTPAARVLNLLAENIEFAVASDIDHIGNLQPGVDALKAGDFITVVPGIKLTWSGRKYAQRFHTVFPLAFNGAKQDGGMPQRPQHVMVRSWLVRPETLPAAPRAVLLDDPAGLRPLTVDIDGDGAPDLSWGSDPMNIENPADILTLKPGSVAPQWLQSLQLGYRPTVYASSDEPDNWHANARVRTYVRVPDANPGKIDPLAVVKAIQSGDSFVTTGPFLDVSLTVGGSDKVFPGQSTTSKTGECAVHVTVQAPARTKIERIDVLVNGKVAQSLIRADNAPGFSGAPAQFKGTLNIKLEKDANIVVVASGSGANLGRRNELDATRVEAAVTNPIWVDVGGDGYKPSSPVPFLSKVVVGSLDNEGSTVALSPVSFAPKAEPGQFIIPITNKTDKEIASQVQFGLRPAGAVTFVDIPAKTVKASIPQYQNKPRAIVATPLKGDTFDFKLAPGKEVFTQFTLQLAPGRNPGGFWIYAPRVEEPYQRTAYGEYLEVQGYTLPFNPKAANLATAREVLKAQTAAYALNSPGGEKLGDVALVASPSGLGFELRPTAALKGKPFTATLYLSNSEKWETRAFDAFFKVPQPLSILAVTFAVAADGKVAVTTSDNITSKASGHSEGDALTAFIPSDGLRMSFKKGQEFLLELQVKTAGNSPKPIIGALFESAKPESAIVLYGRLKPE